MNDFTTQIKGNGYANLAQVVVTGSDISGPINIVTGGLVVTGDVTMAAGVVSVTATSTTATVMDVAATGASHAGNIVEGRAGAGSTGISMSLAEGTNALFEVRLTA